LQDAVQAISMDGTSIAIHRRDCNQPIFTSLVIDDFGDRVLTHDLSKLPAFADAFHEDGYMTMTADALTVIMVDRNKSGLVAASRPMRGIPAFGRDNEPFAAITVTPPAIIAHPVISPDGLAFYYTVRGSSNEKENGVYEALRTSTREPFPPGKWMEGEVNFNKDIVTGISGDRLTLFYQAGWAVGALTRKSLSEPFSNPNHPIGGPTVPGFRTRPFAHCKKLIGTCVSGCNNEDSCVFSR
jgi:hypothetical protein